MNELRDQLQGVFRNVFNDDALALQDNMTAADIEGWDSLMHINVIIAVEKRFGIKFATAEISGMKEEGENIELYQIVRA